MQAEIGIKYQGIDLTVCGEYDPIIYEFWKDIQILHSGTDIGLIVAIDEQEKILSMADAAYKEYLIEKNMGRA